MRRLAVLPAVVALACASFVSLAQNAARIDISKPLPGFTAASSATERGWESKFQALPDSKHISDNMHLLAAHPHNVCSAAQRANAE